jgi:hypothetical protein
MAGVDPVRIVDAAEPRERRQSTGAASGHDRASALAQVLATVRGRWGHGSIVRLDEVLGNGAPEALGPALAAAKQRRPQRKREYPPWWPAPLPNSAVARPHVLEVIGEPSSGRLTLTLAWLAAARPALAAFVDTAGAFYPPAATIAGVSLERLILIRPPPEDRRAPLDAVAVLLRSEAFDVVVCPLPASARISLSFAGKLATLAARSGTSLLLLTQEREAARQYPGSPGQGAPARRNWVVPFSVLAGGRDDGIPPLSPEERESKGEVDPTRGRRGEVNSSLGAFADYRIRLTNRRWIWKHGELVGLKIQVVTERARGSADDHSGDGLPTYEIRLRFGDLSASHSGQPSRSLEPEMVPLLL